MCLSSQILICILLVFVWLKNYCECDGIDALNFHGSRECILYLLLSDHCLRQPRNPIPCLEKSFTIIIISRLSLMIIIKDPSARCLYIQAFLAAFCKSIQVVPQQDSSL